MIFIILFFYIGQPFGTRNDICIGLAAIFSGVLISMLYAKVHTHAARLSQMLLAAGLAGALIALGGAILVISGTTGWYLAGLSISVGNALVGSG